MKRYIGLLASVFMFSACCAAPVRQQVDLHGQDVSYHVSIRPYPRYHTPRYIVFRPIRPRHIHKPPRPPRPPKPPQHQSPWRG